MNMMMIIFFIYPNEFYMQLAHTPVLMTGTHHSLGLAFAREVLADEATRQLHAACALSASQP